MCKECAKPPWWQDMVAIIVAIVVAIVAAIVATLSMCKTRYTRVLRLTSLI